MDHTSDQPTMDAVYLIAELLIPGKGDPVPDQAVICEAGKIVYRGPPSSVPSKYASIQATRVPYLLPGLWDCHSHFIGQSAQQGLSLGLITLANPAESAARCTRLLLDVLYAGFTSCIELGGFGLELQKVISEGTILGPSLYCAGAALTMTGGHGDAFDFPLGCIWHKLKPGHTGTDYCTTPFLMADGVDECRKAVRMNLRRGAKLIKVFTSGGVTSLSDNPLYQQFSDDELKVIVEEASRYDLICTAHAIGKAGIMAAIRAGFKVIQHNSYADDEVVEAMKKNDIMAVFTMTPFQSVMDNKDKFIPSMYEKASAIVVSHKASYTRAIKAGVKCALGADLTGAPGSPQAPGINGIEVCYAVEAGMSPLRAIEAATANGPLTLGPQAPLSGQIKKGYDADLIALEKNPLEDINVLKEAKNVKWIWKSGKLIKAPGLNLWDVL